MFRRLCNALGAPELVDHPDYRDGPNRSRNRVALNAALAEYTRQRTSAEWVRILNEASVATGPIYTVDQTMTDPQVQHLGIAKAVNHPLLGAIEVVGQAVHLERTPQPAQMRRPAPAPGEHTEEVLASLGYDAGAIAGLRTRGVI